MGEAMLDLIARLSALPDGRQVWGLTSHYHLGFHSENDYRSPSFVSIIADDKRNYWIEYLMPKRIAPWPAAYVKGTAQSVDQAVEMVLIAMDKSEGWNTATSS